jgi:hypothetical protein
MYARALLSCATSRERSRLGSQHPLRVAALAVASDPLSKLFSSSIPLLRKLRTAVRRGGKPFGSRCAYLSCLGISLHYPTMRAGLPPRLISQLASAPAKPHIGVMVTATNKKAASRRSDTPKRAVMYRGVKIIPKTGKRSPIAKVIRDGLRTKSEHSRGEAQT